MRGPLTLRHAGRFALAAVALLALATAGSVGFQLLPLGMPQAYAHAVVSETSLKEKTIKADAPARVVLTFNSGIDVKLSRVFLLSKGDVQTSVPIGAGPKPGSLAVELPALAEGDYALRCRVFAADGHLTEEIIRFRVGSR